MTGDPEAKEIVNATLTRVDPPIGWLGTPGAVAAVVEFLASDEASKITAHPRTPTLSPEWERVICAHVYAPDFPLTNEKSWTEQRKDAEIVRTRRREGSAPCSSVLPEPMGSPSVNTHSARHGSGGSLG